MDRRRGESRVKQTGGMGSRRDVTIGRTILRRPSEKLEMFRLGTSTPPVLRRGAALLLQCSVRPGGHVCLFALQLCACALLPSLTGCSRFLLRRAATRAVARSSWAPVLLQQRPRSTAILALGSSREIAVRPVAPGLRRRFASDELAGLSRSEAAQQLSDPIIEVEASENNIEEGDSAQSAAEELLGGGRSANGDGTSTSSADEGPVKQEFNEDIEEAAAERTGQQLGDGVSSEPDAPMQRYSRPRHIWNDGNPPDPSPLLYVGNLYYHVTADQVERIFSRFGEIEHVRLLRDARNNSRGCVHAPVHGGPASHVCAANMAVQDRLRTFYRGFFRTSGH